MSSKFNKYLWASALAALVLTSTGCGADNRSNNQPSSSVEPVANINVNDPDAYFRVFNSIYASDKDRNIVFSPVSAETLTAMLYEASDGNTRKQIEDTLGINDEYCKKIINVLNAHDDTLKLSNHMRVTDTYFDAMLGDYNSKLTGVYNAALDILNSDSIDEINEIIYKDTNGMIKDILKPGDLDGIDVFAMNCCAFDAEWVTKFKNTTQGVFISDTDNKYEAEFMYDVYDGKQDVEDTKYIESAELGCYGIAKSYVNQDKDIRYKFVGILPESGETVESVISKLNNKAINDMLNDTTDYWKDEADRFELRVLLPKVVINNKIELDEIYKALGVTDLFSNSADMSNGFDAQLSVDKMEQAAVIDINETGTKAAAVSYAACNGAMRDTEDVYVREIYFKRPYVYMIYDTQTGTIDFIGVVNKLDTELGDDVKDHWSDGDHKGHIE